MSKRIQRLAKPWKTFANRMLPRNRFGDHVYSWLEFVALHGRRPKKGMDFNDYLYRLKCSGALLELPRQMISDKEHCKAFVDGILGTGHTIPTIGLLRHPDEVSGYAFPDNCVIKPTHLTGAYIVRRDGARLDRDEIRAWFGQSLYVKQREMNYRYLVPKVIVEPVVFDGQMIELKIQCWQGRAKLMSLQPDEPRTIERLDPDWNRLQIRSLSKSPPTVPTPRPVCLERLIEAAETLAAQFDYIRVDAYVAGDDFLIGELTNLHMNMGQRLASLEDQRLFSETVFGP